MSEPLVLALVSDAAIGAALAAGFEEEGVPVAVVQLHDANDPLARAREAARQAILGIGIGGDGERLALILAGMPARPYLEGTAAAARSFGRDAARIAAHRPLVDSWPSPASGVGPDRSQRRDAPQPDR